MYHFLNTSGEMQWVMWFINRVGEPDDFKCETSGDEVISGTLPQVGFSNSTSRCVKLYANVLL